MKNKLYDTVVKHLGGKEFIIKTTKKYDEPLWVDLSFEQHQAWRKKENDKKTIKKAASFNKKYGSFFD